MDTREASGESLRDQSVVIVGNGGSLLGSGLGTFIDSHDIVVRFNLFKTGRYAKDAGTKTTFWFSNRGAHSQSILSILLLHDLQGIYVHTWKDTTTAVTSFCAALALMNRHATVTEVPKTLLHDMKVYLGEDYSMFSTGAIGTWVMLQKYPQATLVGFDWWNPIQRFHYCDKQATGFGSPRGHQPKLEKKLFDMLVREGKLLFGPTSSRLAAPDCSSKSQAPDLTLI